MPESECNRCREKFFSTTEDELKKLEIQHHAASAEMAEGGFMKHYCNVFTYFDEGGTKRLGVRAYAHGKYLAI